MERNVISMRPDNEDYNEDNMDLKCGECGEEFHKPLWANVSSEGNVQSYYACPHCLTQVPENVRKKNEDSQLLMKGPKKISIKADEDMSCLHFFGYLKKRSKDTAIPEDCLTCEKMLECMVH